MKDVFSDKYRVKLTDDDIVTPEETLADALSDHSSVEVPIGHGVFRVFYVLILLVVVFFGFKAFQLQVLQGERFALLVDQSRLSKYPVPSLRGMIYDVNDIVLVENVPTFDAVAVRSELLGETQHETIQNLARILDCDSTELDDLIDANEEKAIFVLERNLNKEIAVELQTASLPGVYLVSYAKRNYPFEKVMGHLLGYTTLVTEDEVENSSYYLPTDRMGRIGLESQYEEYLKGEHRTYDLKEFSENNSYDQNAGNNLHITIDSNVQEKLYEVMSNVLLTNDVKRGAAIVQDVNTGAVIGIVSFPAFDPNIFESPSDPDNAQRIEYILDSTLKPLFNRSVGGLYPPGSTIKPFMALIGLREGAVDENTLIYSEGFIEIKSEVDSSIVYTFKDWKKHGWSDIRKAIADSVDVYFYALGGGYGEIEGVGITKINHYLTSFFADALLGIDIPQEQAGLVPSRGWKKKVKGETWYVGDTYNVSIGQGDLTVTPLWINSYISAIANGGKFMKPYIVSSITNSEGDIIKTTNFEIMKEMPFDKYTLDIVRSGMRQTITEGTGKRLSDIPVALAGKTGTAQITGDKLNSLFTVYGPYEDPEIAMTVVVENIGDDQSLAAQVADNFLMWYFSRLN